MTIAIPNNATWHPAVRDGEGEELCVSQLRSAIATAGEPPFRGGIAENCAAAPMGKGYANDGKPFDLSTACYLREPLEVILQDQVRKMVVKAGVKTMKSFLGEMMLGYFCSFGSGDCSIYFGTEEMGEDQATTRILDYLWGIPSMAEKRKTIIGQWDETMKALKFPDKTLRISPANLTWAQDLNLEFVAFRDAHVTKATGMIDQIIARTTQYPDTKKIFIESQGGEVGFDFDRHYDDTDQRELHVKCPACGQLNIWNWKGWHRERPDDFQATLPKAESRNLKSDDEIASATKELTDKLLKPERRHCGFKRGDELLIKLPDGEYDEAAILRETYYECYHCGSAWHDDGRFGPTRCALDSYDSVRYIPARPNALISNVGFNFPQWINRRLPWGEMMLEYLKHKKTQTERGNVEPLKQWWQKVAGRTWDPKLISDLRIRRQDAYDVALAKHDAWRLCMIVDNQLDLMTQWVMVLAVKKNGNVKQLWRGALHGLDEVRKKQMEYVSAEGKPLIKDQFVFLDGRYKGELICRHIVEHKYGHWATMDGERTWLAWNLMMGSAYEYFSHADEKDRTRKFVCGDWTIRDYRLDGNHVEIWSYPFSATMCGQRFEGLRDLEVKPGAERPLDFLPKMPDEPPDDHELSHHAQIYSNKLTASKSYAPRAAKMHYVPVPPSAPDHYFHCWRMMMAVLEIWGVDGVYANAETPVVETVKN